MMTGMGPVTTDGGDMVANQQELREQPARLTETVRAVEQLMRDVG